MSLVSMVQGFIREKLRELRAMRAGGRELLDVIERDARARASIQHYPSGDAGDEIELQPFRTKRQRDRDY